MHSVPDGTRTVLSALEEEGGVFVACIAEDTRWRAFAQAAVRHGVRSTLSPIASRRRSLGEGLESLAGAARDWSGGEEELCDRMLDRFEGDNGQDDVAALAFQVKLEP